MRTKPLQQKIIGVLGGCSNVATAEYYRLLNEFVNTRLGGWEIAETLIVGMNFGNIEAWIEPVTTRRWKRISQQSGSA